MATPRETFERYNPYGYLRRETHPRTSFQKFAQDTLDLVPEPYKAPLRPFIPDTPTIAPTGALTSPNIIGTGLGQFGKILPNLGAIAVELGPKWALESALVGSDTFETFAGGGKRDLGWWQLPFEMTRKNLTSLPELKLPFAGEVISKEEMNKGVRDIAGTISDATDVSDLLMYYTFSKGPMPTATIGSKGIMPTKGRVPSTHEVGAFASWLNINPVQPKSIFPAITGIKPDPSKMSLTNTFSMLNTPSMGRIGPWQSITPSGYSPFSQIKTETSNLYKLGDRTKVENIGKGIINVLQPIIPKSRPHTALAEFGIEAGIEGAIMQSEELKDPSFWSHAAVWGPLLPAAILQAGQLSKAANIEKMIPPTAKLGRTLKNTLNPFSRSHTTSPKEAEVIEAINKTYDIQILGRKPDDISDIKKDDIILLYNKDFQEGNIVVNDLMEIASLQGLGEKGKYTKSLQHGDFIKEGKNIFINIEQLDQFKKAVYKANQNFDPKEFKNKSSPTEKSINKMFTDIRFDQAAKKAPVVERKGKKYFNLKEILPAMVENDQASRMKIIEYKGSMATIGETTPANTSLQLWAINSYMLGTEGKATGIVHNLPNSLIKKITVQSNNMIKILDPEDTYYFDTFMNPLYKRTLKYDKEKFSKLEVWEKEIVIDGWKERFNDSETDFNRRVTYEIMGPKEPEPTWHPDENVMMPPDDTVGDFRGSDDFTTPDYYRKDEIIKAIGYERYLKLWENYLFHPFNYLEPRASVGTKRMFTPPEYRPLRSDHDVAGIGGEARDAIIGAVDSGQSGLRPFAEGMDLISGFNISEDIWGAPILSDHTLSDEVIEVYLQNPWVKAAAFSKLLRSNKNLLKPKDDPFYQSSTFLPVHEGESNIMNQLMEDPRFEQNKLYGAWKMNEEDAFINKDQHVKSALEYLRKITQESMNISLRGVNTPVYPYLDFPDLMLHWGQPAFGTGNIENLAKAAEYNINIMTMRSDMGEVAHYSQLHANQKMAIMDIKEFDPLQEMREDVYKIEEPPLIGSRFAITEGRSLASGLDPEIGLAAGYQNANDMINMRTFKGLHPKTIMGGQTIDNPISDYITLTPEFHIPTDLSTHHLEQSSTFHRTLLRNWTHAQVGRREEDIRFNNEPTKRIISNFGYIHEDPNSPMSMLSKVAKISGFNISGIEGGKFWQHNTEHTFTDPKTGLFLGHFRYEVAENFDRKGTSFIITELQQPNKLVKQNFEIGAHMPFTSNEIFTRANASDALEEAKRLHKEMTPNSYTMAEKSSESLGVGFDIPNIPDRYNHGLIALFRTIRSEAESLYISDNIEAQKSLMTEYNVQNLDKSVWGDLLHYNLNDYTVAHTSAKFNRNITEDLGIDHDSAINRSKRILSWSGGKDKNLDMVVEARTLAILEHYFKSTIAPIKSLFQDEPFKLTGKAVKDVHKKLFNDMKYENIYNKADWDSEDFIKRGMLDGSLFEDFMTLFSKDSYIAALRGDKLMDIKGSVLVTDPNTGKKTESLVSLIRQGWDDPLTAKTDWFSSEVLQGMYLEKTLSDDGIVYYKLGIARGIDGRGSYDNIPEEVAQANIIFHEDLFKQLFSTPESRGYNKEEFWKVYDHVRDRMRYSTFDPVSTNSFSPSARRQLVSRFIDQAVREGHTNIVIPTKYELALRNHDVVTAKNLRKFKFYDELPDMIGSLIKQKVGVTIKKVPYKLSSDKSGGWVPPNGYSEEGVMWQPNERSWNIKLPKELHEQFDAYTKDSGAQSNLQRVDGEVHAGVDIFGDGGAIIRAFKKADLRSAVHEIAHILRRDLDDEELRIVNEYFNIENGAWTTKDEEAFAKAMEDYYFKNIAPSPALIAPFKHLWKAFVYLFKTHIWSDIIHGHNAREFNSLLKKLLDQNPDTGADESIKQFLKSDEIAILTDKMSNVFNITKEEAISVMASIQGRARHWSERTGKPPSEWWEKRGFDIVKGDEKDLERYNAQAGLHVIERQNDNAMPNTVGGKRFEGVLNKVLERVKAAPKYRDELKEEISKQRSIEAGRIHSEISAHWSDTIDDPLATAGRARDAMGGTRQNTVYFEPLVGFNQDKSFRIEALDKEGALLSDEIKVLFNEIILQYQTGKRLDGSKFRPYDYNNTSAALRKILLGEVPARYEIDLLKKVFGKKGEQLGIAASKKKKSKHGLNVFVELLLQSPKTLMSSMDFSGLMRQGWLYVLNPLNLPQTLRAQQQSMISFASGNRTKQIHDALVGHELFEMAEQSGLQVITPDSKSISQEWSTLTNKDKRAVTNYFNPEFKAIEGEELFGSETIAARLVPWAKMSERGYTTVLNWLRFQRFEQHIMAARRAGWFHRSDPFLKNADGTYRTPEEAGGQELTDMDLYSITDGINTSTGAGRLNFMFTRNPDTGKMEPNHRWFETATGNLFWAFKLGVSRFKVALGVPHLLQVGKKIGGSKHIDSNLSMTGFIKTHLKRKKKFDKQGNRILDEKGQDTGKPYWVNIEMGGTSFISNSPLAKKMGLTKYYNGEGFEYTLANGTKIKVPDFGVKLMHIPDAVASVSMLTGTLYGLKQVFEHYNIDAYVGYDPKSADFGKIVVGPVRADIIGGYGPVIRFIANQITGRTTRSGTSREYEINRIEGALRLARSKMNPVLGKLTDFIETERGGAGFMGEKFDWTEDLWDLIIGMNDRESAEIFLNSLPPEDGGNWYSPIVMSVLSTLGAGGQTYFTADTVIHTYFRPKSGDRLRFTEVEPYIQSMASQFVPQAESIVPNSERTIDEVMSIWNKNTGEKHSVDDLTYQEALKARLFKLQSMVEKQPDGSWRITDPNILNSIEEGNIKASTLSDGRTVSPSLAWALWKKISDVEKDWSTITSTIFNIKYGTSSPEEDISAIEDSKVKASAEYHEALKNAEYELGIDSVKFNHLEKEWLDKYAPLLYQMKNEEGRFTDKAIQAIEKNPSILNKYVSEEWKYTIRNHHSKPIPIGLLNNIFTFGFNKDGSYSSAYLSAWEKYKLPQLLREEQIKTYGFKTFRSGMLDIPVKKDHQLTPDLLQEMLYYNVEINHDGTTGQGLPID